MKKRVSILEMRVTAILQRCGITDPVKEYKFHETRRWRFDFAWPERKIALECEGAVWAGGRHTRGGGYIGDCEKYNAAVMLGWKVLRYSTGTVEMIPGDVKTLFCQCPAVPMPKNGEIAPP